MKILNIVGARPNFMKIAPLTEQMRVSGKIESVLLHTGQHYDENMNLVFFQQLGIPRPDFDLEVGSGSPAWQVGEISKRFEPILLAQNPDAILVVGDVNSTISCALVASYHKIPVFHVEAGLRSFDLSMPEEINRMLTDRLSSLLFTTEKNASENLAKEGIDLKKVHFVGNVMVDTLLKHQMVAEKESRILDQHELKSGEYAVLTLHRPSNVDDPATLKSILEGIEELSREIPVVFTLHPRTERKMKDFQLQSLLRRVTLVSPLPYLDMLKLMSHARLVLTDSGGVQEETTVLGVPCLTIRENTERPITMEEGTNHLVGTDKAKILQMARQILSNGGKKGRRPEFWDGRASERIVKILADW